MYDTPTTRDNLWERVKSQVKKEDPLWGHYVAQKLSALLSAALFFTPITPHAITLISLALGWTAAALFALGETTPLIAGAVLLNLSLIFDCADGQVARLKGLSSHVGGWMDFHADKLKDVALLIGFAYGASLQRPEWSEWIFIAAFAGIAFQFLRNISALHRDISSLKATGKKDSPKDVIQDGGSQLKRSLKHSLLFKLADRVLFFSVFAILNQAAIGIFIYAGLECFYASVSAAINYRQYYRADKDSTSGTQ